MLTIAEPATASAVAIRGDRIVAVGDEEIDALVGSTTSVIDVDGRTVTPGLVDAHSHFYAAGIDDGSGPAIADLMLSNGITTTAELYVDPASSPPSGTTTTQVRSGCAPVPT